jgi:hypothetical protein
MLNSYSDKILTYFHDNAQTLDATNDFISDDSLYARSVHTLTAWRWASGAAEATAHRSKGPQHISQANLWSGWNRMHMHKLRSKTWVQISRAPQDDSQELIVAQVGPAIPVCVCPPERVREVADDDRRADEAVERDPSLARRTVLSARRGARCAGQDAISIPPGTTGDGPTSSQYFLARSWTRLGLRLKPNDWSALPSSGVWIEPERSASNRRKTSCHSATYVYRPQ